jgi:GT2 family glycosyltransferase
MAVPSWPVALERMTIAIASYQRRDAVLRLLQVLDDQVSAEPGLGEDLEVVVVLDGSDDGSQEAIEARTWRTAVRVHWQPNRGLAATRNVGLAAAGGGLVWFLDDDLIPSDGCLGRHRRAHAGSEPHINVGPCKIPPGSGASPALLEWWDKFFLELEGGGGITRFDLFTTANASGPAHLFTDVGGFDESFVAYGLEDYELAVRLLGAGTPLRFDARAVAWHPDVPTFAVFVGRQRSIGYNAARLAHLHPKTVDLLFPLGEVTPPRDLLRIARLRSPRSLMAASSFASGVHRLAAPVHRSLARPWEHLARTAAHAAGVAEADPDGVLLDRLLAGGLEGGWWRLVTKGTRRLGARALGELGRRARRRVAGP